MTTLTAPSTKSCNSGATHSLYRGKVPSGRWGVSPVRRKTQGNAHQDISRDHLTASEVKLLIEVVKSKGG